MFALDIKASNILLRNEDTSVFAEMEKLELEEPTKRKEIDRRLIYRSRTVPRPTHWGLPILCDFGEARSATADQFEDIMPEAYRAPEVILRLKWDSKVDIWSFGLLVRFSVKLGLHAVIILIAVGVIQLWDLLKGWHLFQSRDKDGELNNVFQLAQLVAYLGNPPPSLIERGGDTKLFFEDDGKQKS